MLTYGNLHNYKCVYTIKNMYTFGIVSKIKTISSSKNYLKLKCRFTTLNDKMSFTQITFKVMSLTHKKSANRNSINLS